MVLLIIIGVLTNSVGTSTEYSAFIIATEGEVRFDSRLTRFFRLSLGSDNKIKLPSIPVVITVTQLKELNHTYKFNRILLNTVPS
jgi:hypothetical protein